MSKPINVTAMARLAKKKEAEAAAAQLALLQKQKAAAEEYSISVVRDS